MPALSAQHEWTCQLPLTLSLVLCFHRWLSGLCGYRIPLAISNPVQQDSLVTWSIFWNMMYWCNLKSQNSVTFLPVELLECPCFVGSMSQLVIPSKAAFAASPNLCSRWVCNMFVLTCAKRTGSWSPAGDLTRTNAPHSSISALHYNNIHFKEKVLMQNSYFQTLSQK